MEFANNTLAAGVLDMIAYPGPWLRYILSLYALKNVSNMFSATKHKYFLNVLVFLFPFLANIVKKHICEASGANEQMSSAISAQSPSTVLGKKAKSRIDIENLYPQLSSN